MNISDVADIFRAAQGNELGVDALLKSDNLTKLGWNELEALALLLSAMRATVRPIDGLDQMRLAILDELVSRNDDTQFVDWLREHGYTLTDKTGTPRQLAVEYEAFRKERSHA